MRMSVRRFTRLTNAFSKKIINHSYATGLYGTWYNFCRPHKTLGSLTTPAMAAGLADGVRDMEWLIGPVDANAPEPGPRGPYKRRLIN